MAFKTSLLDLGRKTMIIKSFGAGGGKSFDLKRQVLLERNPTGKEEKKNRARKKEGQQKWKTRGKARREQNFYNKALGVFQCSNHPGPPNSNGLLLKTYQQQKECLKKHKG